MRRSAGWVVVGCLITIVTAAAGQVTGVRTPDARPGPDAPPVFAALPYPSATKSPEPPAPEPAAPVPTPTVTDEGDSTLAIPEPSLLGHTDDSPPAVAAPGGGRLVFPQVDGSPAKRYVLLYGTPDNPGLGALGEQDPAASIARVQQLATEYQALTTDTVIPGVEIIATIASAHPGDDGNYSQVLAPDSLLPLVQMAGDAGLAVVIDLQPGRTDFLTQAKLYEPLLELPYVSLALDPEWRLGPNQRPLRQFGHVDIDEVNAVADWLADLVQTRNLPQKMLVLHEFAPEMIPDRERLDTSHDELAVVIHMDGQGSPGGKAGTWQIVRANAPVGVHWGWKNFYHEDKPMLSPAETYAVVPTPDLVTYQ